MISCHDDSPPPFAASSAVSRHRSKKKARGGGNAVVELTENNFEDMVMKSDEVRRDFSLSWAFLSSDR